MQDPTTEQFYYLLGKMYVELQGSQSLIQQQNKKIQMLEETITSNIVGPPSELNILKDKNNDPKSKTGVSQPPSE